MPQQPPKFVFTFLNKELLSDWLLRNWKNASS